MKFKLDSYLTGDNDREFPIQFETNLDQGIDDPVRLNLLVLSVKCNAFLSYKSGKQPLKCTTMCLMTSSWPRAGGEKSTKHFERLTESYQPRQTPHRSCVLCQLWCSSRSFLLKFAFLSITYKSQNPTFTRSICIFLFFVPWPNGSQLVLDWKLVQLNPQLMYRNVLWSVLNIF